MPAITRAVRAAADPRAERVREHYDSVIWELEAALRLGVEAQRGDLVALTDSAWAIVRTAMRRVR
jgi:hypothetical protein